jgi:nucleoside phosphorylase
VHFKPVTSGEIVLTATGTPLATQLRSTYDDAAAVEMESAGIAQAAHLNRALPVLSVRGISDRADASKYIADAAGWQHIAAGRAAAFTVSIATLALRHRTPMTDGPSSRRGKPT